jgi:hypothetical protein
MEQINTQDKINLLSVFGFRVDEGVVTYTVSDPVGNVVVGDVSVLDKVIHDYALEPAAANRIRERLGAACLGRDVSREFVDFLLADESAFALAWKLYDALRVEGIVYP